jgi:hypothetical protein
VEALKQQVSVLREGVDKAKAALLAVQLERDETVSAGDR